MENTGRKRRGHSRYIIFFVLILAGLGGLVYGTYTGLCHLSWLSITKIDVTGNSNVQSSAIQGVLHEFYNRNLVEVSTRDIKTKLSQIKRIEKVSVIRLVPHTLRVKITERKGFLYVKSVDGDLFPIDDTGTIIEYAFSAGKEDMPIVDTYYTNAQLQIGKKITDAYIRRVIGIQKNILAEKPDFVKNISEYYWNNGIIYIVDAQTGTRLIIGEKDIKDQLRRYQFVLDNNDINKNSILDLRFKNQVVVRAEVQ